MSILDSDSIPLSYVLRRARYYISLLKAGEILRRYFIMNMFDGLLTSVGVVIGARISGALNPKVIVSTVLGASLAMGISGFAGAFMTERAERIREVKELERSLFTNLDNSVISEASRYVAFLAAIIDSLSPLLGSLIPSLPFFLSLMGLIGVPLAFLASLIIAGCLLLGLGFYLGKVCGESKLKYGAYMFLSGLAVAILVTLIGGAIKWGG